MPRIEAEAGSAEHRFPAPIVLPRARCAILRPMTDTILKAAVVGTGHLGRHHTRILSQMPGIEFIGAYDANPEQLEAITTEPSGCW